MKNAKSKHLTPTKKSGCDVIGSHVTLRMLCHKACGFESLHPDKIYLYLKDCRMRVALMGSPQLCWKDSCARTEVRVLTDINNIQSEHESVRIFCYI